MKASFSIRWSVLALIALIALITGVATGFDRDPTGQWVLGGLASVGLASGMIWLWENSPTRGTWIARLIWVALWMTLILSLAICRIIALSAP